MKKRQKKQSKDLVERSLQGYTLVEVILVLGLASLMLAGLIGSSYTAVARQRFNDAVRGVAEYIKSIYDEALAPMSYSAGKIGASMDNAILGKAVEFNADEGKLYSITIVGNADARKATNSGFLEEFTDQSGPTATNAQLYCGESVLGGVSTQPDAQDYTPLWEADLLASKTLRNDYAYAGVFGAAGRLNGTLIIARTPSSATLHTMFLPGKTLGLKNAIGNTSGCNSANTVFTSTLSTPSEFKITDVGICVKMEDTRFLREVRIGADGRNASAVWTRNVDLTEDGSDCDF